MPTYGELFAGIGGFGAGFDRAGWRCAWQVELDPFARRVLERHWSDVPRWDDVRTVDPAALVHVDVLTFGSPCQDPSVAGRRAGLAGERSGLFYEACRIIRGVRPTYVVFENVPGTLSSHQGRDFAAVLDALADSGGVELAWAVLDSRFFGVPQRRRRLYVIGRLGAGASPVQVFAECAGRRRYSPSRQQTGPSVAALTARRAAHGRGGPDDNTAQAGHLIAQETGKGWWTEGAVGLRAQGGGTPQNVVYADTPGTPEVARALTSHPDDQDGTVDTYVIKGAAIGRTPAAGPQRGEVLSDGTTYTLNTAEVHAIAFTNRAQVPGDHAETLRSNHHGALPMVVAAERKAIAYGFMGGQGAAAGSRGFQPEEAPTLKSADSGTNRTPLALTPVLSAFAENQRHEVRETPDTGALSQGGGKPGQGYQAGRLGSQVRRLTPLECERLQGFPDGWTCLCGVQPYSTWTCRCPDGPRYAALGNAVTVNVTYWLAVRLRALLSTDQSHQEAAG